MPAPIDTFYSRTPDEQIAALQLLAEAALKQWPGRFTRLTPVKYRENAVFSVFRDDGRRFAVRIHRHGYHSSDALRSELAWMRSLSDAGVGAPLSALSHGGDALVGITHPAVPEPRQVDFLEWLPGTPIGSADEGLALTGSDAIAAMEKVGALAARVHGHSRTWRGAGTMVRHAWDEHGLIGPEPFWGQFWNMPGLTPAQLTLLQQARERAAHDLAAFGKGSDRYGLIHADFVPENLLFDGERINLIDFDDCGFGWHMFELATALFFLEHQNDNAQLTHALLRGYRHEATLPREHEAMLPLFLFLRGTTYMGWTQTRYETETAQTQGPMIIERTCELADRYLADARKHPLGS
ncbi:MULTISPECIES: phosphotransferase enzyme family protein [unclassified Sphingobium]|uniref:phosphotransferase enzyme family protein n=1 Tax=unclassified Sphingobium TaxID=2611147 RepID=UPI001917C78A|nr:MULTISPECIES: phosphotransferase [unclassified Sphingobium]CAD7340162.1 Stress response kinase A [Sphingobium sp. S6]CAD7340262.1 Stress response kinase A [Sphingobium sp. S8]